MTGDNEHICTNCDGQGTVRGCTDEAGNRQDCQCCGGTGAEKPTVSASLIRELEYIASRDWGVQPDDDASEVDEFWSKKILEITARYSGANEILSADAAVLYLRDHRPDCRTCEIYPEGQAERHTVCKYCVWSGVMENHYKESKK